MRSLTARFISIPLAALTLLCGCVDPPVPAPEGMLDGLDFYFDPAETDTQGFEIGADDMAEFAEADFSAFASLKTVALKATASPEATDAAKEAAAVEFDRALPMVALLKAAPALENVVLQMGEGLFLREADRGRFDDPAAENMKRAWKRYASRIKRLLPGKKIYVYDWAW
jgi:hypothetical protein